MACVGCDEQMSSEPPYANYDDVDALYTKVCAECSATVPASTAPANFCSTAFGGTMDECCDLLTVFEGNNVWVSNNCSDWFLISGNIQQTLFFEDTKADDLSGSFNITNVPSGYDEILIRGKLASTAAPDIYIWLEINGDTNTANYSGGHYQTDESGAVAGVTNNLQIGLMNQDTSNPGQFVDIEIRIQKYEDGNYYKTVVCDSDGLIATNVNYFVDGSLTWLSLANITSVQIYTSNSTPAKSGTFKANSFVRAWVR